MEYQKIINLLDKIVTQPSKFRTIKWVEINDDACGDYNTGSQNQYKTAMLRLSLYDYSNAYMLVKGTIAITGLGADAPARQADERNKQITFKIGARFTNCISEINNTLKDNASYPDV